MVNQNRPEPTWVYYNEIEKLKTSLIELENKLKESIQGQQQIFLDLILDLKKYTKSVMDSSIEESKNIHTSLTDKVEKIQEICSQNSQSIDNALTECKNKVDSLKFDIIDNEDNLSVTYTNADGSFEYGSVKKIKPDFKTLTINDDNVMSLNYKFDKEDFSIQDNIVKVNGMTTTKGEYLDADIVNQTINNLQYNVDSIRYKIDKALNKIDNSNGYVASNNFKKATPEQETLTRFVLDCISPSEENFNISSIPVGTRVKNTFDNHIWVLNKYFKDGLNTYKWEDFGSDSICTANNDGVYGLVTGSKDNLKGFININGTISINGLEEELQNLLQALSEINTQVKDLQANYQSKTSNLEDRLKRLEENA